MSKINIMAAMGEAPELDIEAHQLTDLGLVDTNRVHVIAPFGQPATIQNFGVGREAMLVTKRLRFDADITIKHNPPLLTLLSAADRLTGPDDVGVYTADENSLWTEEEFTSNQMRAVYEGNAPTQALRQETIVVPPGFTRCRVQLVGAGGNAQGLSQFMAIPETVAAPGGYVEMSFSGMIAGKTMALIVGSFASSTVYFTRLSPGTTNPANIPILEAGAGASGSAGATPQGAASGYPNNGDINERGLAGTLASGVRAYTPGNRMSPPQEITVPGTTKSGLKYGGAALSLGPNLPTGTNYGAPGVAIFTWRK